MTRGEIIRFLVMRTIGNFLVLFALFGVFATFGPAISYEVKYRVAQARGITFVVREVPEETKEPEETKGEPQKTDSFEPTFTDILYGGQTEHVLVAKDTDFSIVIPKIGATAKILPNIDSSSEEQYKPALEQGVAHAKGTVFPGMKGNIYLFAHSTDNFWDVGRYNAVFYLIKDLTAGDDVVVFFENKRHNYKVESSHIVDDTDVSSLVKSQDTGNEKLILQTCWPPGTTWKRLVVTAKPK